MSKMPPPPMTVSDGGVVVHYRHPQSRGLLFRPFCNTAGWEDRAWQPDDGVGADVCGRCIKCQEKRVRVAREASRRSRLRAYHKNRETEMEKHRAWVQENRDIINRKKKLRRQGRMVA